MKNYFVNEGNRIGGMEPQGLGDAQTMVTASAAVTKGQVIEVTGNWTVGPAADGSVKVCGIAANDAAKDAKVVIETEGFVKLDASDAAIAAGDKVVVAGDGKVKKLAALTVSADPTKAEIEAALAGLNAVCGIVIAGCDADGHPYVKFSV